MSYFPSTTPTLTHRLLAIVAMVVLLAGKTVHVHQECSDCCNRSVSDSAVASQAESSPSSCAFGCDHHCEEAAAASVPGHEKSGHEKTQHGEPGDDTPGSHDQYSCAVCSVLAAAPECPLVLGLPAWTTLVQPAVLSEVSLPETVDSRQIRLRGPPIA